MKTKFFGLFLCFVCVGLVSSQDCVEEYGQCLWTSSCCDGGNSLWCWGYSPDFRWCHSSRGRIGTYCSGERTGDMDCFGDLVCTYIIGEDETRCSECRQGDHTLRGVDDENIPGGIQDQDCTVYSTTCSCNLKSGFGSWHPGYWESEDDVCDHCDNNKLGDDECWTGLHCLKTQDKANRRCLPNTDDNCCYDGDCNSGQYCNSTSYECVVGTTSTTTTTTTTQSTTTTTTLDTSSPTSFGCEILVNVSQSQDDGYEDPGIFVVGDWNDGGEIVAYNVSDSVDERGKTLGFIFRDVPLPNGLTNVWGALFLYTKNATDTEYMPAHFYNITTVYDINTDDLSNTNKPSDLNISAWWADGGYLWYGSPYVLNDTWYGINVTTEIYDALVTNDPGWEYKNNLTIIIPTTEDTPMSFLSYYSYEDDPLYAARLCLNYTATTTTTTTLPTSRSECATDETCNNNEWCVTYELPDSICIEKKKSYVDTEYSFCFRNHECYSGKCTAHDDNSLGGDYPLFDLASFPYSSEGYCIPKTFSVEHRTYPIPVVKGSPFSIYMRVEREDELIALDKCILYFDPRNETNLTFLTTAWAYSQIGNEWNTSHSLEHRVADWNYMTNYPLSVNETLEAGEYGYYLECIDEAGDWGLVRDYAMVRYNNFTSLVYKSYPPEDLILNQDFTVSLYYMDVFGVRLSGATCTLEWNNTNHTMTEENDKSYKSNLVAMSGEAGIKYEVYCKKATYEDGHDLDFFTVQPYHCNNGVKDENEEGVDCGGSCEPCVISECIGNGLGCYSDGECCGEFCNPITFQCRQPRCDDGFLNQGEHRVDCGGRVCDPCPLCINNNDCSGDGSSYCDSGSYSCAIQNCTVDSQCYTLTWYIPETGTYIDKETLCDTNDNLCKFDVDRGTNQTVKKFGLDVVPLSGLTSNQSGVIFHVFNCDEKDKLGFMLESKEPTTIFYSFASSGFSPSLTSSTYLREFDKGQQKTVNKDIISELCTPDDRTYGGVPKNSGRVYARINFKAVGEGKTTNKLVDVVVFKKSLKNMLNVRVDEEFFRDSDNKFYLFNASNRSVKVWVKNVEDESYVNISAGYIPIHHYNHSAYTDRIQLADMFYYFVNSSFGEVVEDRYGSLIYSPIEWDEANRSFKLNFKIRGWMIWLVVVGFIVLAAVTIKIKRDKLDRGMSSPGEI